MSTPEPPPPPERPPPPEGAPAFRRDDAPPPQAYQWGEQPAAQQQGRRNGLGIAALVLGVLGILTALFLIGGLFGLLAVVLGFIGRGRVKRGEADNGGVALAGIITGVIAMVLAAGALVISLLVVGSESFQNLTECLAAAGEDQAAAEACIEEFQPGN